MLTLRLACVVLVMSSGCAGEEAAAIPDLLHARDAGSDPSDAGGGTPDTGSPGIEDAGTDANIGHDAGPTIPPGCETPEAVVNLDGVLSAYPDIFYAVTPGGFELLSANFKVTEDGDPRGPLLQLYAEVRNNTSSTECTFLPDVSLAFSPLIGLVEGPPYLAMSSRVTSDCLGPGEVGVLRAVERGIDQAQLDAATTLFIDMMPNTFTSHLRAASPVAAAAVDREATGWLVAGQVTFPFTLYNYGIRVYPKDNRGLIIDELLAFPGDLDTMFSGSVAQFATDAASCPFEDYVLFQSWIDGPNN